MKNSYANQQLAVVTGAGRGLGAALTLDLARRGFHVLMVARTLSQLEARAQKIRELVPSAQLDVLELDLSQENASSLLFEKVDALSLPLSLLVNNAGAIKVKQLIETSLEDWALQIRLNATIAFELSREALKRMGDGPAAILNIASLAGIQSEEKFPGFAAYSASKSALVGFSQALASELEEREISVLCVAPGAIDTQMLKEALPDYQTSTTPEFVSSACMELVDQVFLEKDYGFKLKSLTNESSS